MLDMMHVIDGWFDTGNRWTFAALHFPSWVGSTLYVYHANGLVDVVDILRFCTTHQWLIVVVVIVAFSSFPRSLTARFRHP